VTAYMVGDVPAAPVLLSPARDGRAVDLSVFDGVTATLLQPNGLEVVAQAELVDDSELGHVVSATVPGPLDVPGLLWLQLVLFRTTGGAERFMVPVVVQRADGWHTLASARAEWPDAEQLSDARLYVLLETSRLECVAYGRPIPAGQLAPVNYREAQLMHARNRNAAWRVDPNSSGDDTSYQLGAHPLDWVVKQLLRPQVGGRVPL
jgi:hypothetical protein